MLKNKYFILPLVLTLALSSGTTLHSKSTQQAPRSSQTIIQSTTQVRAVAQRAQQAPRLSRFDFGSASVLPFFIENNKKFFILSREAYGPDQGTYDDFGGKRDPGENHPIITAAREFFEEAILELSAGLSLQATGKFIDINANNTECIVACSRNVAYITNFSPYKNTLLNNFYSARNKATSHHLKEKDRLALVEENTLKKTIIKSTSNTNVMVQAQILNSHTKKLESGTIKLRPYFVKKLRPFFMDKPYQQGMNKKIRFYDITPPITPAVKPAISQPSKKIPAVQESWLTRFWNWIKSYSR